MSKDKLYKRYGLLKDVIGELTHTSSKEVHKRLKNIFSIESLRDLSRKELYEYILQIEIHFMTTYGVDLLGDAEETLSDYLKKQEG